jgi:transposase
MDNRDEYGYGWNQQGQRFHALKSGRREGRVNMIAALCEQNLIAPFTVEGACNRTVFETWLETCLLPTLVTGQIVVMDNATFHKGGRIEQLIQNAGCQLLYLPPYSPDLNKIEQRRVLVKESNPQTTRSGKIVYEMRLRMSCAYRPNRLGGCYSASGKSPKTLEGKSPEFSPTINELTLYSPAPLALHSSRRINKAR